MKKITKMQKTQLFKYYPQCVKDANINLPYKNSIYIMVIKTGDYEHERDD